MSGGIEEPYTIAQLPRPIENGKITASPVCSFNGSRKRKRHEVAVGIDGEGVNIYNVQNQSTVTSYPLPPQCYLAAPPCSVYCKRAKPLHSQRQTYVALRDGFRQTKLRLVSFTEEQGKVRSEEKEPRLPAKREYQLRHGDVIGLDILGSADDTISRGADHSVLVLYKSGDIECLPSDLSGQRWHQASGLTEGGEVEYATVVDLESARKGLLKNRDDALALLDISNPAATTGTTSLLFQIILTGSKRTVRIHALRDSTGPALQTSRSPLEELLSYELAYRYGSDTHRATYELRAGSGNLYQHLDHRLALFDLSGIIPNVAFELGRKGVPRVHSFARLSSATLLAVTSERVVVYDTKYGSTLSSLDDPSQASLSIISQFTDLGIMVATSHNNLVAFQVGDILDDGRRARAHGPLLIDVMGKSKFSESNEAEHLKKKKASQREKWENWKTEVDGYIKHQQIDKLEDLVSRDLRLEIPDKVKPVKGQSKAKGHPNGHPGFQEKTLWKLPPYTYDPQSAEGKKAVYLLSKTFSWSVPTLGKLGDGSKLKLAVLSRNLLRWLALAGYLTPLEIEHALSTSSQGNEIRPRVAPGDIMAAVQEADPTFTLLCDLVSLPIYWELAEIVAGLQKLVLSLGDRDGIEDGNGDVQMTNGDEESQLASETAEATKQLELATRLLESGLTDRSEACRILLARLQAFPQRDIAMTMHKMLTYEELRFLMSVLRLELFDGNWALQYIEPHNNKNVDPGDLGAAQDFRLNNQAIRSIARLLSCAIDAVGMSGWLVGLSADTIDAHDTIQSLRNEIAAAAEGLYDASYIEVLLNEVGKMAGSIEEEPASHWRKRKADALAEMDPEDRLLPLGSRKRMPLSRVRKLKSGQSVNPTILADERSRKIGKYAFERIRI